QEQSLKSGGGDGTYFDMTVVDAKIAASEARTDTKFAQVLARLDNIEKSTHGIKTTTILTGIAAVGVTVAVIAFGASQFGNGVMVTSAAVQDAAAAKRISEENASELRALRQEISSFMQA